MLDQQSVASVGTIAVLACFVLGVAGRKALKKVKQARCQHKWKRVTGGGDRHHCPECGALEQCSLETEGICTVCCHVPVLMLRRKPKSIGGTKHGTEQQHQTRSKAVYRKSWRNAA